jgi:hypothetical protein
MIVTTDKITKEITLNDGDNIITLDQMNAEKLAEILSKLYL